MKLITRGYGNNQQIITRGYGSTIVQVVQQGVGAAYAVLTDTISLIRYDIHYFAPFKIQYHIGKFKIFPFSFNFHINKLESLIPINLLVHHFDIRTQQFINSIKTGITSIGLKFKHENLSE